MAIVMYKKLQDEDIFKGLKKTYSTVKYAHGGIDQEPDETLKWYLIDRNVSNYGTDDLKNLFMSFGLARPNSGLTYDRDWSWIDVFNAERMLVGILPQSGCGTYIDGATVEVNIPTGITEGDYVTFYGSGDWGYIDPETGYEVSSSYHDLVYGGEYVYLYPNTQGAHSIDEDYVGEHPYTGTINGQPHSNSGLSSWSAANTNNATLYPHLRATSTHRKPDDGRDDPYGLFLLGKGIVVMFDRVGSREAFVLPNCVAATLWTASAATNFFSMTTSGGSAVQNGNSNGMYEIIFSGTYAQESAKVKYRTISYDYKMIYFCHAGQGEFNRTTNHSYDARKAYFRPDEADSIYVTEVGLFDENDEMLAYAKLSEPVEKNMLETITFKVELQI